jgi:hypothetical protein
VLASSAKSSTLYNIHCITCILLLHKTIQEGRIAALDMVRHLLRRLPVPLLDEHAHLFFLALAVRLVGDESQKCRAAAGAAISAQLPRLSGEVFQQLLDYVMRWFGTTTATADATLTTASSSTDSALLQAVDTSPEANKRRGLHKTAAVCAGLFVQARPDLLRRGDALPALLRALSAALPLEVSKLRAAAVDASTADADSSSTAAAAAGVTHPWECVYHAAVCLERVLAALPAACDALLLQQSSVQPTSSSNGTSSSAATTAVAAAAAAEPITALEGLCACLLYPHAWVRLACARAWGVYLSRRDPITLAPPGQKPVSKAVGKAVGTAVEFLREKGGPFRLCKQTAAQLDRTGVDAQLLDQAVKNLVWVVRAMHANPELCYIAPAAAVTEATIASSETAVVVARSGRKGSAKQQNGSTATAAAASANGGSAAADDDDSSDNGSVSDGAGSASDVDSDNDQGDSPAGDAPTTTTVDEPTVAVEPQQQQQQQRDPLVWIFHRMSFMGRAKGDARRRAVFKWFAAMGAALPVPVVARFLPHMLTPLRRCALDAAANDIGGADEGDVVMTNSSSSSSTAVAGEAAAGVAPVADLAAEVHTNTSILQ